jgi:hypothetical protein
MSCVEEGSDFTFGGLCDLGNLGIGMLDLTNYLIHFPNLMSMFGVAIYSFILVFVVALGAVIYFTHCKAAEPSGGHRRRRRRSPVQRGPAVRTAPVELTEDTAPAVLSVTPEGELSTKANRAQAGSV